MDAGSVGRTRRLGLVCAVVIGAVAVSASAVATGDQVQPDALQCFRVDGDEGDVAIVNLTPVDASARGWGVLVASDVANVPPAASVNYDVDSVDPNVAMAEIDATGTVCFRNSTLASVHLVADQLGTIGGDVFTPAADGTSDRILDTRDDAIVAPGGRVCAAAAGDPGDVAVVNLAPVDATGPGNGLLVSSDIAAPPVAANVNYDAASVNPNLAAAEIGVDGDVCFVNAPQASVHVVMDQIGAIDAAAINMAGFDGAPVRILDSRDATIVEAGGRTCARVSGFPGDVAMVNVTPVEATGNGNGLVVSSDVIDPPVAANVNYRPGSVDPNIAFAPIGLDGQICFVNADQASVHVVLDQIATLDDRHFDWWSSLQSPVRLIDTRIDLPTLPPEAESVTQGGTTWAVVLAGASEVGDPALAAAAEAARRAGYAAGPTDCDVGAPEAVGLSAGDFTVSVYLDSEADANLARVGLSLRGVEGTVAEVQTFCLD